MLEIGKKYKFLIRYQEQETFYTGIVKNIEGELVFILDKFEQQVGFNKNNIVQFREVKK